MSKDIPLFVMRLDPFQSAMIPVFLGPPGMSAFT